MGMWWDPYINLLQNEKLVIYINKCIWQSTHVPNGSMFKTIYVLLQTEKVYNCLFLYKIVQFCLL